MATTGARHTTDQPSVRTPPVLAPPILCSSEPAASGAFYAALLGWRHEPAATGPGGLFRLAEEVVARWIPADDRDAAATWLPAFAVRDTSAAVRRVRAAGGTPLPGPPGGSPGRSTAFTDPTGARFALGAQPTLADGPGSLGWTELFSTDTAAAKAFYRSALGWRGQDIPFEGGTYTVLTRAAGSPTGADGLDGHAGIRQLHPAEAATGLRSHWLPYLEVKEVDQAVADALGLGATLRTPARHTPGLGRCARLADPQGAEFAVLTG
ncbi:VOC family protein [Kitasatospora sp. NBC_00374]|uniref:VOC family protein n=1 Tax=Kitasatospora sp. NBC_00374 TaxID=2975964 RepID=UPI0030E1B31D